MARLVVVPLALAVLALADASPVPADKGGPSPGVVYAWSGVLAPSGDTRYVALPSGRTTMVAAVGVRGGRIVRYRPLPGAYGVPLVAWDGSTAGLSGDGRTLVLASYAVTPAPGTRTRFAVLSAPSLRPQRVVELPGSFSFDALSPDGSRLYVIEYLGANDASRYRVRSVDVKTGRLLPGAIIDVREPDEDMSGSALTRATNRDGRWAYTLYGNDSNHPFVHALDTLRGAAFCIDLPWHTQTGLHLVRMSVGAGGGTLTLRQRGVGKLATVDTRTFEGKAFRAPLAQGA